MDMNSSPFEGIYVVAKFYLSRHPDGSYRYISRTLGKFSIVDREFKGTMEHKDVWVCRISREIRPGKGIAAFVLMPIKKIKNPSSELRKLIPGYYDIYPQNGAALVIPNQDPSAFWVMSKITRSLFSGYYAIVVPIQYEESTDSVGSGNDAVSTQGNQEGLELDPNLQRKEDVFSGPRNPGRLFVAGFGAYPDRVTT